MRNPHEQQYRDRRRLPGRLRDVQHQRDQAQRVTKYEMVRAAHSRWNGWFVRSRARLDTRHILHSSARAPWCRPTGNVPVDEGPRRPRVGAARTPGRGRPGADRAADWRWTGCARRGWRRAGALHADDAYVSAGATLVSDGDGPLSGADVVVSVQPLPVGRARHLRRGSVTISFLPTTQDLSLVRTYRDANVTAFSLELVPRISRAQSMDALSSQALVAGYRAALVAAERLPRFFPLFMTAAGTVPPARVLVLGAGVAGLQAIATARRLGAQVEAYDVRAAAAERSAAWAPGSSSSTCPASRARAVTRG